MRLTRALLLSAGWLVAGASLALAQTAGQATWLDGALAPWNAPGMAMPRAPQGIGFVSPQCQLRTRPAAGAEENAVLAAGWQLTLDWPSQRRGDVVVVMATSDFDGMCRPLGFNAFVFSGGRLAGSIAPEPMGARSDGTLVRPPAFLPDGRLDASFVRFAPGDPLCCPSRPQTRLRYRVEQREAGPVLLAERPAVSGAGSGMRMPVTGSGPETGPDQSDSTATLDPSDATCSTD